MKILLTGVTGYIGGRLLKELETMDISLRCMARNPEYVAERVSPSTELCKGDVFDPPSLLRALSGVHTAYYNVHSLGGDEDFEERDRIAARNFGDASRKAGVKRIIYLSGLGKGPNLSKHLASRQEVGAILGESGVPTMELRASIVIGSGSLSFEMVRSLVEKLPVMTTPKWVRTLAQPISVEDVLKYLTRALSYDPTGHEVFEIGGADKISYDGIMRCYAEVRGLKRLVIPVPILSPGLSGLWLALITPLYYKVGRWLIDGVKNETLVTDDKAERLFAVKPRGIREALERALKNEDKEIAETRWSDALGPNQPRQTSSSDHVGSRFIYSQSILVEAPPQDAFLPIQYIGGHNGWYSYQWLWTLRGFIDKLAGGVGMGRGRKDPLILMPGDVVDSWRVEDLVQYKMLRLRAEMKVPGRGWLQFEVTPEKGSEDSSWSRVSVHAIFEPLGLKGRLYWYTLYFTHKLLFTRMLNVIRGFAVH